MQKQSYILRFERFIKKDPYWKGVYTKIAEKIKSDMDYQKFAKKEKKNSVEEALNAFEFRLFSESNDIEKLSKISGHRLFEAFTKFYMEFKDRRSLLPVYRVPPPECVWSLLKELGDGTHGLKN